MKPVVFIHTNDNQLLGAKISAHSLKAASQHPEEFEVRILRLEEQPHLGRRAGQSYLRNRGMTIVWKEENPQSFTPLRFLPPQLMDYCGRALVIDPDVFAVGDVHELLTRDMGGKALLCCRKDSGQGGYVYASSVMLLDCEKLRHWRWDEQIDEMFAGQRPYRPWINLELEPEENIGLLEEHWNHFDKLDASTRLIHFTRRRTQPWKTGLPMISPNGPVKGSWLDRLLGRPVRHSRHPDRRQVELFFAMLQRCLDDGAVTRAELSEEVHRSNVRPDVFKHLDSRRRHPQVSPKGGALRSS